MSWSQGVVPLQALPVFDCPGSMLCDVSFGRSCTVNVTLAVTPHPLVRGGCSTSDRVAYMNANLDASKDGDGAAALTEEEKEAESMERQHRQANEDAKALHHFSYVALSGVDGSIRWKHDTDSLEEEANEEEVRIFLT